MPLISLRTVIADAFLIGLTVSLNTCDDVEVVQGSFDKLEKIWAPCSGLDRAHPKCVERHVQTRDRVDGAHWRKIDDSNMRLCSLWSFEQKERESSPPSSTMLRWSGSERNSSPLSSTMLRCFASRMGACSLLP